MPDVILKVPEKLGESDTAVLSAELDAGHDGPSNCVLDFSGTKIIEREALRSLIGMQQKLENAGDSLELVNVSGDIAELFALSGISEIIKITGKVKEYRLPEIFSEKYAEELNGMICSVEAADMLFTLDFSETKFVEREAMHLLLSMLNSAENAGNEVKIINAAGDIMEMFNLIGISEVMNVKGQE